MTGQPAPASAPSDEQLADILRFLARTCLEVERGLRPPAHLRTLMDRASAHLRDKRACLGRFRGGPVHHGDIGRPQACRLTDTHILATITTRTEGDRWGALTLQLRARNGRWHIAEVHRLPATTCRATPAATIPHTSLQDELACVTENRRLAQAAHHATSSRLADLTSADPGHSATRDLVRYWDRTLGELDRQLAELNTREQTRGHVERVLRR